MLNLPVPPRTRISRQLTCVSCHEQFTIAEDDSDRDTRHSGNWQLPTNHYPHIQLRYQSDRSRRATMPEVYAIPDPNNLAFREWDEQRREPLYCPRCGADNRNWLHILQPTPSLPTAKVLSLLPQDILVWQERFPVAFLGVVAVSLCFLLVALTFMLVISYPITLNMILLFFIIVAVIAPTSELTQTKNVRELRENQHLRKIKTVTVKDVEAGYWFRGFSFVFIIAIVIPLLFFQLGPRVLSPIVTIIKGEPAEAVDNVAAPYLQSLEESLIDLPDEVQEMTKDLLVRIASVPDGNNEAIARVLDRFSVDLNNVLEGSAQSVRAETVSQIQAIGMVVDDARTAVQEAQEKEVQERIIEAGAGLGYLALWQLTVGLASFISVFTSMRALKDFVTEIDNQLPPPLFHNIANMTRVVVWEAKRVLEIGDEVQHMQWTAIQRNDQGGIDLQGLYRDNNQIAQQGDPLTTRVLAQRYEITSDRWGHIIDARVKAVRVWQQPKPSRPKGDALEDEFFGAVPNNQPTKRARP